MTPEEMAEIDKYLVKDDIGIPAIFLTIAKFEFDIENRLRLFRQGYTQKEIRQMSNLESIVTKNLEAWIAEAGGEEKILKSGKEAIGKISSKFSVFLHDYLEQSIEEKKKAAEIEAKRADIIYQAFDQLGPDQPHEDYVVIQTCLMLLGITPKNFAKETGILQEQINKLVDPEWVQFKKYTEKTAARNDKAVLQRVRGSRGVAGQPGIPGGLVLCKDRDGNHTEAYKEFKDRLRTANLRITK